MTPYVRKPCFTGSLDDFDAVGPLRGLREEFV